MYKIADNATSRDLFAQMDSIWIVSPIARINLPQRRMHPHYFPSYFRSIPCNFELFPPFLIWLNQKGRNNKTLRYFSFWFLARKKRCCAFLRCGGNQLICLTSSNPHGFMQETMTITNEDVCEWEWNYRRLRAIHLRAIWVECRRDKEAFNQ